MNDRFVLGGRCPACGVRTAGPEQCGAIGEGLRRGAELAGIEIPGGETEVATPRTPNGGAAPMSRCPRLAVCEVVSLMGTSP